jgi:integrase
MCLNEHSWATILKRKGISTSLISEGLGHANQEVTQIYLDSFESEAMDELND